MKFKVVNHTAIVKAKGTILEEFCGEAEKGLTVCTAIIQDGDAGLGYLVLKEMGGNTYIYSPSFHDSLADARASAARIVRIVGTVLPLPPHSLRV